MAEVKNAFIKSKMNKDLDDRLLPSGEYRDAINIAISRSEASDVGALENVIGNTALVDFWQDVEDDVTCIGTFVSEDKNTIFFFMTSNNGEAYDPGATQAIVSINTGSGSNQLTLHVQDEFLNFSTLYPVIGVNLLENLLFFTDNRNQPRRIDITKPDNYYFNEDQVSVASYNPYQPIDLWQPSALAPSASVPYETTMKDVVNEYYPGGGGELTPVADTTGASFNVDGASVIGNPVVGDQVEWASDQGVPTTIIEIIQQNPSPPGTQLWAIITDNSNAQWFTNEVVTFNKNPYFNIDFQGDPDFLQDKFVRFSYRFQFEDNTYSLMAPYTQEAFIPKQDGYFLNETEFDDPTTSVNEDQEQAYRSTVVDFMENKVNQITLKIPLPSIGQNLINNFKIKNLQILFKESDTQAIQVVDTIEATRVAAVADATTVFTYDYNSTKPFQTLPSNEIIRVYDKIPVKAFGQEVISNRIVYSNFQTKHSPPASIDYNVNVSEKQNFDVEDIIDGTNYPVQWKTSYVEYPNHSLKQNRNYQVGFVLSDRYGRTSTTILSNDGTDSAAGLSTVYVPYRNPNQPQGDEVASVWPGDSLKINVNNIIPTAPVLTSGNFYPGVYNGNKQSPDYNPLGWYSYKIVVKQNEQEYYNVYLPGILNGYPQQVTPPAGTDPPPPFPTGEENYTANVVLINDNINKVPRDLSEVGPEQKQFRSSVRLFGRVTNLPVTQQGQATVTPATANTQFYPGVFAHIVSNIATTADSNMEFETLSATGQENLYQIDTKPLIARITTTRGVNDPINIGVVTTGSGGLGIMTPQLAIYETEPNISRLDIYYETTTSGLISDLNFVVENNTSIAAGLDNYNFFLEESASLNYSEATGAPFTDPAGADIPINLYPGLQALGIFASRVQGSANRTARFPKTDWQGNEDRILNTVPVGNTTGSPTVTSVVDDGNAYLVTVVGGAFGTPNSGIQTKFVGISSTNANGNFAPEDSGGTPIPYTIIATDAAGNDIFSAVDGLGNDVTNYFQLVRVKHGDIMLDGSTGNQPYSYDSYYIATKGQYFYKDGFSPNDVANTYQFSFSVIEADQSGMPVPGATPSSFTVSNNQLTNVSSLIANPFATRNYSFQEGQGPPTNAPMYDFIGYNGSNINNQTQQIQGDLMYEHDLIWNLTSVQVGGQAVPNSPFDITNYQDPTTGKRYGRLTQDGTAIGAYDLTVTLTDSNGSIDTSTFQVIFGETPLTGSLGSNGQVFQFGVGEATTIFFTGPISAGTAFSQMNFADQGFVAIPQAGATGGPQFPASPAGNTNGFTSSEACADCNETPVNCNTTASAYNHSVFRFASGSLATGYTLTQGLVDGTAYINITLISQNTNTFCSNDGGFGNDEGISGPASNFNYLYSFGSFNIDYKPQNGTQWQPAVDLNGDYTGAISPSSVQASYSKGEWRVSALNTGDWIYGQLYSNTNTTGGGGSLNGVGMWETRIPTLTSNTGTPSSCYASRTFAFDTPGDYRIVTNNMNNNNWKCNTQLCGQTSGFDSGNLTAGFQNGFKVTWGDFYYDFGNQRAFAYRVSFPSSSVNPSAGNTVVYAKEPLFRYITQFYTDTALTIPKTWSNGGTVNVRTVGSGGTNFEEAGNWSSGQQPTNYPFEFAGKGGGNPGNQNQQNQELRQWLMDVSANGTVTAGSQVPRTS